jgi:hypothetical protein
LKIDFQETRFEKLVVAVKTSTFGLTQTWISSSWATLEAAIPEQYLWKFARSAPCATHRNSQQIMHNDDPSNTMFVPITMVDDTIPLQ